MIRYAQIDENGFVVSDSYLNGEVESDNMIRIDEKFDLTNKKYVNGSWETYTPEPIDPNPTQDEVNAEILLNQMDIMKRQEEQDAVLAEILLNGLGV